MRSALSARWGAADAIQTLWQQGSSTSNQGVLASSTPTASGQFLRCDRGAPAEAVARNTRSYRGLNQCRQARLATPYLVVA